MPRPRNAIVLAAILMSTLPLPATGAAASVPARHGNASGAHLSACDVECIESQPGAFKLTGAEARAATMQVAPQHIKETGDWCQPAYPDCSGMLRTLHGVPPCRLTKKPNFIGEYHCRVEVETCYGHAYPTPAQPEGVTNCTVHTEYEARVEQVQAPRMYRNIGESAYLRIDGKRRRVSVPFLSI
jgi:hypothetical protein